MFAKINHVAIVSSQYALSGRFYEALFGMKPGKNSRPGRAVVVGDGYVGLNINPRRPSRSAGLDHFGTEVDDVGTVFERIEKKYSSVKWLKRPGNRPFAGITTHDPDGNVFDLSQRNMENRKDVYADGEWQQDRYIDHFALRTMNPEKCAEFYSDVLELTPGNRKEGDDNYYLTDGRITLMLMPWDIENYAGTGITRPGPDHFGFKVESLEAFKNDIAEISGNNPYLTPQPLSMGPEGKERLKLFAETCPFGQYQLSDVDGVLVDVRE